MHPGQRTIVVVSPSPDPRAVPVGFVGDRLATWTGFGLGSRYSIRSPQDIR